MARLHTQTGFLERIHNSFEGDFKVHYHLAPPLWSQRNNRGELVKKKFGPIMLTGLKILAKLKGLRGTRLDIFGKTEERQTERALIARYREGVQSWLGRLNSETRDEALAFARSPEAIKGFGHVKARHLAPVLKQWR